MSFMVIKQSCGPLLCRVKNNPAPVTLQHLLQNQWQNILVKAFQIYQTWRCWYDIHLPDNEPYITEDVFISCVGCLFVEDFGIELVLSELEKYGVVDESSFHIVLSLSSKRRMIDRFHFIMYKLGRRENGLQTFYRCMKETKDRVPEHSDAVHILAFKGQ